jgi:hypothetical protein
MFLFVNIYSRQAYSLFGKMRMISYRASFNIQGKMEDANFMNNSKLCSFYEVHLRIIVVFPSRAYYVNYAIGCALNIILTISAIFLNSLTVITYWKSPQLRRKSSYFLIMLLSVNDLLVGILGNANHALTLALTLNGNSKCVRYILVDLLAFPTAAISFTTLFTLNVERYLSIVYPIYYRTKVTKSKLLRCAVLLCLVSIGLTVAYPTLGEATTKLTSFIMYSIILATCYIYVSIFITARRTARVSPGEIRRNRTQQSQNNQNMNLAKSCAIVVICTVICYLPFALVRSEQQEDFQTLVFAMWSVTFALAASSVNNVVFFLSNPVFRNEVKKIFRKNK